MSSIQAVLQRLASVRLTVILLALSMLLVFSGTLAQRHESLWLVQKQYFQSLFVVGDFEYVRIPLPGGYVVGGLLILNLLAAFLVRFRWSIKKMGLNLLHLGILVLLVGELITGAAARETQMVIDEGKSSNWTHDFHEPELVVLNPTLDENNEVVVDRRLLRQGSLITAPELPFDIRIERWYDHANLGFRAPTAESAGGMAMTQDRVLIEQPTRIQDISTPGAEVTILRDGRAIGQLVLWFNVLQDHAGPQPVVIRDRQDNVEAIYFVDLRARRYYHPFTIHLNHFTHERYPGTNIPKRFASDIRLVDPETDTDRPVLIEMNHPLRYRGKTFFQASFANEDQTSILQVVKNPVWTAPYIGCLLVAVGMSWHFLLKLSGYLRNRRSSDNASVAGGSAVAVVGASRPGAAKFPSAATAGRGSLEGPKAGGGGWAKGIGTALAVLILVLSWWAGRTPAPDGMDLQGFSQIPVLHDGRIKPVGTVARAHLMHLAERQSIRMDDRSIPAIKWYLKVIADRQGDPDLLNPDNLLPTLQAFLADFPADRRPEIIRQRVLELRDLPPTMTNRLISVLLMPPDMSGEVTVPEEIIHQIGMRLNPYLQSVLKLMLDRSEEASFPVFRIDHQDIRGLIGAQDERQKFFSLDEIRRGLGGIFFHGMNALAREQEQRNIFDRKVLDLLNRLLLYAEIIARADIHPVAPIGQIEHDAELHYDRQAPAGEWLQVRDAPEGHPSKLAWQAMAEAYGAGDVERFNQAVTDYRQWLAGVGRDGDGLDRVLKQRIAVEYLFNRLQPFHWAMLLYVLAFLVGVVSWLGWSRPLRNIALGIAVLTLTYHTIGLGLRIHIHQNAPVTSLYSSAVFVGWVAVILGIILERFSRNAIALVAGSVAGCGSLLIAQSLSSGDDFEAVRAVLNTPFWLTTHVLTITIGYAAMFVAGIIGILYLFGSVSTGFISHKSGLSMLRMVYGVICFAALFSLVGTILGGIWADQSWGRFWGWDPKENGALLIVLLCAIILHARWSGMIADRGIVVLAILGNIVTAWSWFGVNLMGVGLHSYGFTDSGAVALRAFVLSQLGFMAIALIPRELWKSGIRPPRSRGSRTAAQSEPGEPAAETPESQTETDIDADESDFDRPPPVGP